MKLVDVEHSKCSAARRQGSNPWGATKYAPVIQRIEIHSSKVKAGGLNPSWGAKIGKALDTRQERLLAMVDFKTL